MSRILVVEDNQTMREGIAQVLAKMGHQVLEAEDGQKGVEMALAQPCDLVITDYRLPGLDGIEVLRQVKRHAPASEVIVITAYGTIGLAVQAMQEGAADFITKPFSHEELRVKVEKTLQRLEERRELERVSAENLYLRQELEGRLNFGEIIGESAKMKEVYATVEKVAPTDATVLIYGESGTGKELIARAIHRASRRRDRPFVRVHCGALAEGVLESELFGHERGAFTGALRRKRGRFELAHTGSIFLDEVGDIPQATQLKLLRVLQEKEFERVGGEETLAVDVRIIAATNRDLAQLVREGKFREDLYYRLHIVPIYLPPLRARLEDVPALACHFLGRLAKELGKPGLSLDEAAMAQLCRYHWPGNVRELENVLERAAVLAERDTITVADLPPLSGPEGAVAELNAEGGLELEPVLERIERTYLERALAMAGGVKTEAARLLGLKPSALYYKLAKYGLLPKNQ
ncbi:MAG: sigma-54-dependent Fis family transcriptional regulator [Calditrichaeota bacterium]|nr:sigma-54-dependent Fis family transcriptional regulator [Calditrichota bacterium]